MSNKAVIQSLENVERDTRIFGWILFSGITLLLGTPIVVSFFL